MIIYVVSKTWDKTDKGPFLVDNWTRPPGVY